MYCAKSRATRHSWRHEYSGFGFNIIQIFECVYYFLSAYCITTSSHNLQSTMPTTRRSSRRNRGGTRRSVCPSITSAELCGAPLCKWNAKLSKCRKAPVKRVVAAAAIPRSHQAKLHDIATIIDPEYDDYFSATFSNQARNKFKSSAEIPEDKCAQ